MWFVFVAHFHFELLIDVQEIIYFRISNNGKIVIFTPI